MLTAWLKHVRSLYGNKDVLWLKNHVNVQSFVENGLMVDHKTPLLQDSSSQYSNYSDVCFKHTNLLSKLYISI